MIIAITLIDFLKVDIWFKIRGINANAVQRDMFTKEIFSIIQGFIFKYFFLQLIITVDSLFFSEVQYPMNH
jgi:hypothetical protein